jgi:hypothetical protein
LWGKLQIWRCLYTSRFNFLSQVFGLRFSFIGIDLVMFPFYYRLRFHLQVEVSSLLVAHMWILHAHPFFCSRLRFMFCLMSPHHTHSPSFSSFCFVLSFFCFFSFWCKFWKGGLDFWLHPFTCWWLCASWFWLLMIFVAFYCECSRFSTTCKLFSSFPLSSFSLYCFLFFSSPYFLCFFSSSWWCVSVARMGLVLVVISH